MNHRMNRRPRRLRLLLAAVALLLTSQLRASGAGDVPDARAARVDALFADLNRAPSPGVAIAVVRDGKVILRRGYGLASVEHRVPVTPSTVFDTASLSKQFTGLAVAMLVSEGKVKLGDDVRKYIPELHDFGRPITVEHLLRHTSGLRDWYSTLSVAGWRPSDPITYGDILTLAYHQRSLNFAPGSGHLYTNTGYNLLAELVQRVTRRPFRAWAEEHIFRPLGMADTRVRDDFNEVIPNRAYGYAHGPGGSLRTTPNNLTGVGSSSVFSTADDFARWLINFGEAGVGGRAALSLMQTPGALDDGTPVRYGFGITTGRYKGLPFFTSSGAWASFNTYDAYFPEQKFGVVVLANSGAADAQSAVIKITDIYLEKDFAAAPPPAAAQEPAPKAGVSAAAFDEYAGLYRLGPDSYARVERYETMLLFLMPRRGHVVMSPTSENEFSVEREDEAAAVVFRRGADGKVASLTYDGRPAPRVAASEIRPPADLSVYAGDYDSEELGASYRVTVADGALQMQHRRRGDTPLKWLWGDEFRALDAHLSSVEFKRDGAGRVNGLVVNGSERSRDIRFTKRRS